MDDESNRAQGAATSAEVGLSALARARAKLDAMRAAGQKADRLDPIEKARRNTESKALAIAAQCFECVGRGSDPNWRKEVAYCTAYGCSIWPHRPHREQAPADYAAEKREAAVAAYPRDAHSPLRAAAAQPQSRRLAIAGKCYECMGSRRAVATCPSSGCPLWHVRPSWKDGGNKA